MVERTPDEVLRDRAAHAAADALRLLLPQSTDASSPGLGHQNWRRMGGRMRVAAQRRPNTSPARRFRSRSGGVRVLGVPAPRGVRRTRVRARISSAATARVSSGKVSVRRSLYPRAQWLQHVHGSGGGVADKLNPSAKIPPFLRRGAGHAPWQPNVHSMRRSAGHGSRHSSRDSRSMSRSHRSRSSGAGRSASAARSKSRARVSACAAAHGDSGPLWDSRMASGMYADGMHDGCASAEPGAEGARKRMMAARRKRGSYLFGPAPVCVTSEAAVVREDDRGGAGACSESPGARGVCRFSGLSEPDKASDHCGREHSGTVDQRRLQRLPQDRPADSDVGTEAGLWRVGPTAQGSQVHRDALQAAVGRVAQRDEDAFAQLANVAVAGLDREFWARARSGRHASDASVGDAPSDLGGRWGNMHAGMVCVPTHAGDSMTSVPDGKEMPATGGQAAEEAALQARAARAALQRRRQRWHQQRQQAAQQRRQWREGGLSSAREILLAQEILDRVVGQEPGVGVGAEAASRPCTGAPVMAEVPIWLRLYVCDACQLHWTQHLATQRMRAQTGYLQIFVLVYAVRHDLQYAAE